ncbi:MAG: hypothetical protein V1858_00880 [Candidatus Gottesmanbacteria bacterium]
MFVANHLTAAGLNINQMEQQKQLFKDENSLMEKKIASYSSLIKIAQRAADAGFVKPDSYYLSPEYPVAAGNFNVNTR